MKIGIVGLGYVGLPLAVAFAEEGHQVVGVDIDPEHAQGGRRLTEACLDRAVTLYELVSDEVVPVTTPEAAELTKLLEIERADVAAILTVHPGLDPEAVVQGAPLVVDFRGATRGIEAANLVRL